MPSIILTKYQEPELAITLQTSYKTPINNHQSTVLLKANESLYRQLEEKFNSKFLCSPNPIYNCHGMTFASRRTGIYKDADILKILEDEYVHIKSIFEVRTGDIIIYFSSNESEILHSGVVTYVVKNDSFPEIKILSKARQCGEIMHKPDEVPDDIKGIIKYYRIGHKKIKVYLST